MWSAFSCKGGCGICILRHLKEDSAVAVKKEFWLEKTFYSFINKKSNKLLLQIIVCIATCSLVMSPYP